MPFTALNHVISAPVSNGDSQLPKQIRDALTDLPADIISLIGALWNGEPQASDKATTQKIITALSEHITSLKQQIHTPPISSRRNESSSRKRILEDDGLPQDGSQEKKARLAERPSSKTLVGASWKGTTFDSISFTIPQRKKFTLTISSKANEGLSVSVPGSATPEFAIPWSEVQTVICLPVPEKTQPQKSFVIFPRGINGLQEPSSPAYETMLWTVPDTKAKGTAEDEPTQAQALKTTLARNISVLEPNPKDFTSEIPPLGGGGKKDGKAYHIKAFKGSKDGFLFLLPTGVLWCFKKPIIFFSFACIDSISYTSVLQRTFNLVISARAETEAVAAEYEFSMLDQADFAGIDAYIKKNGLQDASLAEQRRAKVYNVNGKKGEIEGGDAEGDGEGGGELRKAEAEAEAEAAVGAESSDDEDEDENFDPGSEGDDGGSSSGSDDGDGDGAVAEDGDGEDLVAEELGSEAEELEGTDAEDE